MARPTKEGLDYFPLNVDIDQDEKVGLVEAAHGMIGFAIVVKLLMKIYKKSYYFEWGEREQLLFSRVVDVDIDQINEVISTCIKWDLFNKDLFDNAKILTSHGIQLRYLEASRRRTQVKFNKEFCLLRKDEVNDFNNLVIVDINSNNEDIILQSKVDLNKKKKSKEEDIKSNYIDDIFDHYQSKNIIKHSKLTDAMKTVINDRLKDYSVEEMLKAIDNYAQVFFSPSHYFNHKFPLGDLMEDKAIRKFLDEADPINNFKKSNISTKKEVIRYEEEQRNGLEQYDFGKDRALDF